MDLKRLSEQVRERAKLAVKEQKKTKDEEEKRKHQRQAQKERDDYPDLLRTQILAGLQVSDSSDYSDDLAEFQDNMRAMVNAIPNDLLVKADSENINSFLSETIDMLYIKPDVPAFLAGEQDDTKLEPYIKTVLIRNLKARTFAILINDAETQNQVFATCSPATIDQRLNSLAVMVEAVYKDEHLKDTESFVAKCKEVWQNFFQEVREVNDSPFLKDRSDRKPYIFPYRGVKMRWGWCSSHFWGPDCTDIPYALLNSEWWHETENGEIKELVFKVMHSMAEKIQPLVNDLNSISTITRKRLYKGLSAYSVSGSSHEGSINDLLLRMIEEFGVWCTNQCVDWSDGIWYIQGECVDLMLVRLEEYRLISPVAAVIMLDCLTSQVGSCMFYNCPDESYVNNAIEPKYLLEKIFTSNEVKKVFKGKKSPDWIRKHMYRLLSLVHKHAKWEEKWGWHFKEDYSPDDIIRIWTKNLHNEEYWVVKKDEAQSA